MALRTKIEPVESWVKIVVDQDLSPEARSRQVAAFARGRIDEAKAQNTAVLGRPTPETVFVDGREGAALESVNPDRGIIVAEFDLVLDVLDWILTRLRESSPVRSGKYREGHRLFADGKEVSLSEEVPPAEEYAFTNTVPYSSRLEVGKTKSGRAFVIQIPPKLYFRVAGEARKRFGNIADINYTFRGIIDGAQVNAEKMPSSLKRSRNRRGQFVTTGTARGYNKSKNRFPTLTIRLR